MNLIDSLLVEKKNLFQFYIIFGDNEKNKKIVEDFLKDEFSLREENFFRHHSEELKIGEGRKIKRENSYTNNNEKKSKKIYFLDYQKISLESQNSLLKTFEEVGENSHFFLFVPSQNFILDTIKSRARIIQGEKKYDMHLAKEFIEASYLEREKIIEKKISRENISIFMDSLEKIILENKNVDLNFYKNFLDLKKYIFDKGIILKNVLI